MHCWVCKWFLFLKKAWSWIGSEISEVVLDFFLTGKLLKHVKDITLCLIPKWEQLEDVTQFGSIQLVAMCYIRWFLRCFVIGLKKWYQLYRFNLWIRGLFCTTFSFAMIWWSTTKKELRLLDVQWWWIWERHMTL